MPIVQSTYKPNFFFKNTHLNTSYKTLFTNQKINYSRKRITTPDNDFLDLDFSSVNSDTIVIACHGLEGSSNSKYIISACKYFNNEEIDCLAVNFRGCSGEDNNFVYSYHSGKTDDLSSIINFVIENYNYKNIVLLGFSMGGNIVLKYLGENTIIPSLIKCGVAVSVPIDLESSSRELEKPHNRFYLNRFMKTLRIKALTKIEKFPDCKLSKEDILNAETFEDFDNALTAPLFGFKNAKDYWDKSSSIHFLNQITTPSLILNAKDDTFLGENCFPFQFAENNSNLNLEIPNYGGHVGFNTSFNLNKNLWSENRIHQFIKHIIY